MIKNNKKLRILLYILGGCLLVWLFFKLAVTYTFLGIFFGPMPSGKEMMKNYTNHRQQFHDLTERIIVDGKKGLKRIDDNWTDPTDVTTIGMTPEEVKNYRKELEKLGIRRGFYSGEGERVEFLAAARGLSIGGTVVGYLYQPDDPPRNYFKGDCGRSEEELLEDIDMLKDCAGKSYRIYQKIDEGWYIYYEFED